MSYKQHPSCGLNRHMTWGTYGYQPSTWNHHACSPFMQQTQYQPSEMSQTHYHGHGHSHGRRMTLRMPLSYLCLCDQIAFDAPYSLIARTIEHYPSSVNCGCLYRSSPLHKAVEKKRYDVIELLVEKGADVNSTVSWGNGMTPLFQAIDDAFGRDHRTKPTLPMKIIRLLRSEWNVNAITRDNDTLFSCLLGKMYSVFVAKDEFDQEGVDSGRDIVLLTSPLTVAIERQPPFELFLYLATRENVKHFVSNNHGSLLPGMFYKLLSGSYKACRWELVLLYLSLGVDIEEIRGRILDTVKHLVELAPPFLREILTTDRDVAKYEYLPQVFMTLYKEPMSLQLWAAVGAKKQLWAAAGPRQLVNKSNPSEEHNLWLEVGLPTCMANCMLNLDKGLEEWGEQNAPKLTSADIDNLSW